VRFGLVAYTSKRQKSRVEKYRSIFDFLFLHGLIITTSEIFIVLIFLAEEQTLDA